MALKHFDKRYPQKVGFPLTIKTPLLVERNEFVKDLVYVRNDVCYGKYER